jgi:hypothetical protein
VSLQIGAHYGKVIKTRRRDENHDIANTRDKEILEGRTDAFALEDRQY